jgi:hypothetical protein
VAFPHRLERLDQRDPLVVVARQHAQEDQRAQVVAVGHREARDDDAEQQPPDDAQGLVVEHRAPPSVGRRRRRRRHRLAAPHAEAVGPELDVLFLIMMTSTTSSAV